MHYQLSYCVESVFFILNFLLFGENKTKNKTILTRWSVAQAGSNDEKKLWVENLVGLSL